MSAEAPTNVVADTHCHFYPNYDLDHFLRGAFSNLNRLGREVSASAKALYLCDRSGQENFKAVFASIDALKNSAFKLLDAGPLVSRVADEHNDEIRIVNGRQLVTKERIEVLALATAAEFSDGMPARDAISAVRDAGGCPVLSWSPGKWWFSRGRMVMQLIESAAPGDFALGDVAIRSALFPEPNAFSRAREMGLVLLAGSDPLPNKADQTKAGQYSTLFTSNTAPPDMRAILPAPVTLSGVRDDVFLGLRRMIRANVGI